MYNMENILNQGEKNMKELFSIGEIAKLFNMRVGTLRYYDEINILKPEKIDDETGYRYYSTKQFERLNTIKYLRALGMSLEKIESFFDGKDVENLKKLLEDQQKYTQEKIKELQYIDKKIENRLIQLSDALNTVFNKIEEKHILDRRIILLRKDIPIGDDLEYPIRELERFNNLEPLMFLGKVGVSVSQEDLVCKSFKNFSSIFLFIEEGDNLEKEDAKLKESDYVTIRFSGTHIKADNYYIELLNYIENKNYTINGDSVEITLIDLGITNDSSKFVTELQIPVKKS